MKLATAQKIVKAAEDIGPGEVRLRENYGGRGMYGRTTTGVVGSRTAILQATAYAAYQLGVDQDGDGIDEFLQDLSLRWDNMGDDQIAY